MFHYIFFHQEFVLQSPSLFHWPHPHLLCALQSQVAFVHVCVTPPFQHVLFPLVVSLWLLDSFTRSPTRTHKYGYRIPI